MLMFRLSKANAQDFTRLLRNIEFWKYFYACCRPERLYLVREYHKNLTKGGYMNQKKVYEKPQLMEHGSVAELTLLNPSGMIKGCQENCHDDPMFGEPSGIAS